MVLQALVGYHGGIIFLEEEEEEEEEGFEAKCHH